MILAVYLIGPAFAAMLCSRIALQYYQLESYQLGGYFRSLGRNWLRAFAPGLAVTAFGGIALALLTGPAFDDWRLLIGMPLMVCFALLCYWLQRRLPAKKPLIITPRVKRLVAMLGASALGVSAILVFAVRMLPLSLLLPLAAPFLLSLAALIMLPIECFINHLYLRDAMKRLDRMPGLIKIGITGSYGKTSAKFILETILSEKYRVLATPGSFNTSMGVTRVIRERLYPDHQVFIAEMGARHRGDIRLLCKLVRPKYGIITSIGPQHLETFRSQENINREKFELAWAIPPDGAMVFAADGGLCEALYEKAKCPKHLAGRLAEGKGMTAENIEVGPWGSRFTLSDGAREIRCETKLLGAHNISNLLLACMMASVLGMDFEAIARGVNKVKPVEHRLELLRSDQGVMVIDDAFNANPVGANAALDVLKGFPGRRIVVTPGFVELGAAEARYNRAFGEHMAGCVDMAVLVGKRHTQPIAEGLRAKNFPENNLHIVNSLEESGRLLSGVLLAGDVVLYENDLPDNYME